MNKKTMSIEESLESIAIRLDELTGNAMGNSYLNVTTDYPETDMRGVESKLSEIRESISDNSHALYEIDNKLESISESLKIMANGMETFIGWYIENSKK